MEYQSGITIRKGLTEAAGTAVSAVVAALVVPKAQALGVQVDPTVLTGTAIVALNAIIRAVGNWLRHRKKG